jgi:hypothetical protein
MAGPEQAPPRAARVGRATAAAAGGLAAAWLGLAEPGAAGAQAPSGEAAPDTAVARQAAGAAAPQTVLRQKHFWRASGEILGLNTAIWAYDRYIREGGGAGFRIGTGSWEENIENGFEWDDNNFDTNMFAHPYHGSLYFNTARANGYDFWESVPFAFAGSFTWEYLFETHHPSFNDWVMTSVGGIGLGEVLYRLSSAVLDNTATGSGRTWREIAGLAISPMRGATRLLSGEWFEVGPNPPDRLPDYWSAQLRLGLRRTSVEDLWTSDTTRVFLRALFEYGDLLAEGPRKPFDAFTFDAQLNFDEAEAVGYVFGEGLLGATPLRSTESSLHHLGGTLQFTYFNTYAFQFGGASLAANLLSRIGMPEGWRFVSNLDVPVYLLAAVDSDYENFSGRVYDFGPGFGLGFRAALERDKWDIIGFSRRQAWVHAANGNNVDHAVTYTTARAQIPLRGTFGVGVEYALYNKESDYKDYPDVSTRLPELRLYLLWGK